MSLEQIPNGGRGMQTALCGAGDEEAPFVDSRPVMASSPEARYFMQSSSSYPCARQLFLGKKYHCLLNKVWMPLVCGNKQPPIKFLGANCLTRFTDFSQFAGKHEGNLSDSPYCAGWSHSLLFQCPRNWKIGGFTQKKHLFPKR